MKNFSFFQKKLELLYYPLISFLFPNFCFQCQLLLQNKEVGLCQSCFQSIPRLINLSHCKKCFSTFQIDGNNFCFNCKNLSNSEIYFDYNRSCFDYTSIQQLIIEGKFNRRKSIWPFLAKDLIPLVMDINLDANTLVIPVPISKKRRKERGYNQTELIAQTFCSMLTLKYDPKILVKTKHNLSQANLSAKERITNAKDCYAINKPLPPHSKTILLIDDVFTTGSTVNECSRLLKEQGASQIIILTIAKSKLENLDARVIQ